MRTVYFSYLSFSFFVIAMPDGVAFILLAEICLAVTMTMGSHSALGVVSGIDLVASCLYRCAPHGQPQAFDEDFLNTGSFDDHSDSEKITTLYKREDWTSKGWRPWIRPQVAKLQFEWKLPLLYTVPCHGTDCLIVSVKNCRSVQVSVFPKAISCYYYISIPPPPLFQDSFALLLK